MFFSYNGVSKKNFFYCLCQPRMAINLACFPCEKLTFIKHSFSQIKRKTKYNITGKFIVVFILYWGEWDGLCHFCFKKKTGSLNFARHAEERSRIFAIYLFRKLCKLIILKSKKNCHKTQCMETEPSHMWLRI